MAADEAVTNWLCAAVRILRDRVDRLESCAKPLRPTEVAPAGSRANSPTPLASDGGGQFANPTSYNVLSKKKLFVGGIRRDIAAEAVRGHFEMYGELVTFRYPDRKLHGTMGIAFLEYETVAAAARALAQHGTEWAGRTLSVQFQDDRPRATKTSRSPPRTAEIVPSFSTSRSTASPDPAPWSSASRSPLETARTATSFSTTRSPTRTASSFSSSRSPAPPDSAPWNSTSRSPPETARTATSFSTTRSLTRTAPSFSTSRSTVQPDPAPLDSTSRSPPETARTDAATPPRKTDITPRPCGVMTLQASQVAEAGAGAVRKEGIVTEWNPRGFGFIQFSDGRRAYVHHSAIGGRNLETGEPVSAMVVEDSQSPGKWASLDVQRTLAKPQLLQQVEAQPSMTRSPPRTLGTAPSPATSRVPRVTDPRTSSEMTRSPPKVVATAPPDPTATAPPNSMSRSPPRVAAAARCTNGSDGSVLLPCEKHGWFYCTCADPPRTQGDAAPPDPAPLTSLLKSTSSTLSASPATVNVPPSTLSTSKSRTPATVPSSALSTSPPSSLTRCQRRNEERKRQRLHRRAPSVSTSRSPPREAAAAPPDPAPSTSLLESPMGSTSRLNANAPDFIPNSSLHRNPTKKLDADTPDYIPTLSMSCVLRPGKLMSRSPPGTAGTAPSSSKTRSPTRTAATAPSRAAPSFSTATAPSNSMSRSPPRVAEAAPPDSASLTSVLKPTSNTLSTSPATVNVPPSTLSTSTSRTPATAPSNALSTSPPSSLSRPPSRTPETAISDPMSESRSRSFGFVLFATEMDAEKALRATEVGIVQLPDTRGHVWHLLATWSVDRSPTLIIACFPREASEADIEREFAKVSCVKHVRIVVNEASDADAIAREYHAWRSQITETYPH